MGIEMEKLDVTKMSKFGKTIILRLLTRKAKGSLPNTTEWDVKLPFMIEMKVNGIEVPFFEMLEILEEAIKVCVKEEAEKLFHKT